MLSTEAKKDNDARRAEMVVMGRCLVALGVLVFGACAAGPPGPPSGEEIWRSFGGLCNGPCEQRALYRDGTALDFRRTKGDEVLDWGEGRLTSAGDNEYFEAGLEAEDAVGMLRQCSPSDGIDARAVIATEGGSIRIEYCIIGDIDPRVERLQAFFNEVLDGVDNCSSNEWVDAC